MESDSFQTHLAALSPYAHVEQQPPSPAGPLTGSIYLCRHGNIEVSKHDYETFIFPFLSKISDLQRRKIPFVRGRLRPLSTFRAWFTDAHVGMISFAGLQQTFQLAHTFRQRHGALLHRAARQAAGEMPPLLTVWADGAMRTRISAIAFANAFSGNIVHGAASTQDGLPTIDTEVRVAEMPQKGSCRGLSWHAALGVDQQAGTDEMRQLMGATTAQALTRLRCDWLVPDVVFGPEDVYALQLLHCYGILSGRGSPFSDCFTADDWVAFEYLRDVKYHYSEGYAADSGRFALPWMVAALHRLNNNGLDSASFPFSIAFTHREEILYLCCLLGIGYQSGWIPDLEAVDSERSWRVAKLAPYLGHVGLESYPNENGERRLRVVVNGSVVSAFRDELPVGDAGDYGFEDVKRWVCAKPCHWEGFHGFY